MGRLLLIAAAIGIVLALAAGFAATELLSSSGKTLPAHATEFNYGQR